MREGGFDDPSCFGSCIPHPFSAKDGAGYVIAVRRLFRPHIQLSVIHGEVGLGETLGYMENVNSSGLGAYVFLHQAVQTTGVLASLTSTSGAAWIGAGPALHVTRFSRTDASRAPGESDLHVGAVAAAGAGWPTRRRFFLEIQGQYRLVGSGILGPMEVRSGEEPAGTIPRTRVNLNHALVLLGVGMRWQPMTTTPQE